MHTVAYTTQSYPVYRYPTWCPCLRSLTAISRMRIPCSSTICVELKIVRIERALQANARFRFRFIYLRYLRTTYFSRKCGDCFCSNHHLSYADNGQQNIMWGIWMKYCTRVGTKMGTQTKKYPKKTSLFFSSLAKSAMYRWLVAVFFSLVLGSSVRKTSGRLSRDCLEEYRGVYVIN